MVDGSVADGFVDDRFIGVRKRFEQCFETLPDRDRPEWGAAVAAFVDGQCVVDLWSGWADPQRRTPWTAETCTGIASCRKALSALAVHVLVDLGIIDYDDAVARWWPEFARHGKSRITLRHVLSHQAGLPSLPSVGGLNSAADMAAGIADLEPQWPPGTAFGYSGTFDWILQGVVERVTGMSIAAWFDENIAKRFGLNIYLDLTVEPDVPLAPWIRGNGAEWPIPGWWSETAYATARSLAELFGILAVGGEINGNRLLSPETLTRALEVQATGRDRVNGHDRAYRLGWRKSIGRFDIQIGTDGFGCPGGFGSAIWADPERRLGFAFTRNLCTTPHHEYRADILIGEIIDSLPT